MCSVEGLREFVTERLTAAAEEIFRLVETTVVEYEEEISRQRRLLEVVWNPEVRLHRTELPQQHVCKEEEVLSDQQLWIQERNSSLDQEDPEPPQIKEEKEDLCTSQEGEQLVLKQETDTFMLTPTYEESDHSEGQTLNFSPDDDTLRAAEKESVANMPVITSVVSEANSDQQLLSHNSHEAESQDQKGGKHGDSGPTRNAEPEPKKRRRKSRSLSNNVDKTNTLEIHPDTQTGKQSFICHTCGKGFTRNSTLKKHLRIYTELPQQHVCKEDEVLSDQQLNMPVLTSVVSEANSDQQLLSHNSHEAESQDQKGGKHGDSGPTRNAEPEPKKRRRKSRSHSNNVDKTNTLEIHPDTQTGKQSFICHTCGKDFKCNSGLKKHLRIYTELPQQHVCKEDEVLSDQQLNMPVLTSVVSEANSDQQLLSHNSHEAESQDQKGGKHGDSGPTRNAEPEPKKRRRKSRSLSNNVDKTNTLEIHPDTQTELPQLLSHNSHEAESQDQKGGKHGDSGPTRNAEPEPKKRRRKSRSLSNNVDKTNTSEIHPDTQTGKQSFICHTCGKGFTRNSTLKTHLRTHTGEKPYACETCGKNFGRRFSLLAHMRSHTGEKLYSCKTCGKDLITNSALIQHMRIHTGEKPFACKTCGKRHHQGSALIRHMRTHTGEKPYPCKTCGKEFRRRDVLNVHVRIHTGEKPYGCKTCSKSYHDDSALQRHMRTHTGEKPYSCKTCGKGFRRKDVFNVHMRIHTGEKPYGCKTCSKRFYEASALGKHVRTHRGSALV